MRVFGSEILGANYLLIDKMRCPILPIRKRRAPHLEQPAFRKTSEAAILRHTMISTRGVQMRSNQGRRAVLKQNTVPKCSRISVLLCTDKSREPMMWKRSVKSAGIHGAVPAHPTLLCRGRDGSSLGRNADRTVACSR